MPNDEGIHSCCEDLSNRIPHDVDLERDDLVISVCGVCGRRHFELTLDAGEYNFKLM